MTEFYKIMSNFYSYNIMELNKFFQKLLVRFMGFGLFVRYVRKHRLNDEIVDYLIREKKIPLLMEYIKYNQLSSYQITNILECFGDEQELNTMKLVQSILRNNILNEEQQNLMVSKNDVLFLESYLSPNGYYESARRFKRIPEYGYIQGMVKSNKTVGIELFKAYIDNNARDIMTDDLLNFLLEQSTDSFAVRYLIQKVKLSKEQEETLLEKAPASMVALRIKANELISDLSQQMLVKNHFELAEKYFEKYGLRSKAQQEFYARRRALVEETHAAEEA